MMYWVEVKRFGIWRKCKGSEGSEDHAVEFKNDMEYFELKEGLKQYRYRIRCDQDRFSLRRAKPYMLVFEGGRYLSGSYRFSDGTYGYVCNDSNYDPEDFLEDDESEEDLIFEGKRPLGSMYFDRWDKNGEFYQGGCFLYYEGETVKDWCDRNGEPYPVKVVRDKVVEKSERTFRK